LADLGVGSHPPVAQPAQVTPTSVRETRGAAPPQDPLEVSHGGHAAESAAESAAEDENAHVPSRIA
jgi:hypothetical protein